jgi:cell wall-associated NlpC family hydrolase
MRYPRLLLLLLAVAVTGGLTLVRPASSRAVVRMHPRRITAGAHHSTALGLRVVQFARHFLGVPYRYGGSSPRSGFDCSGFVRYVYGHFGIPLPHSSFADFAQGRRVGRWALRPGDLLFFDGAGHVGIYVGHGRFIHAPHSGSQVSISSLAGSYAGVFDGARRVS